MTARDRAVEIEQLLINTHYPYELKPKLMESIVDALLASDFCGDPVRELVKRLWDSTKFDKEDRELILKTDELLRKIVEANDENAKRDISKR